MKINRRSPPPVRLGYSAALRRMFQGGKLVRTNGKLVEYSVVPGGPITNSAARALLGHSLCHADDPGLLSDRPQSWVFDTAVTTD